MQMMGPLLHMFSHNCPVKVTSASRPLSARNCLTTAILALFPRAKQELPRQILMRLFHMVSGWLYVFSEL